MIAVDLRKQQILGENSRKNQQINFTANLDRAGSTRIYFILEEARETKVEFSQGTVKVLQICYRITVKILQICYRIISSPI